MIAAVLHGMGARRCACPGAEAAHTAGMSPVSCRYLCKECHCDCVLAAWLGGQQVGHGVKTALDVRRCSCC